MKKFLLNLVAVAVASTAYASSSALTSQSVAVQTPNPFALLAEGEEDVLTPTDIVTHADVELSFTNDEVTPWTISEEVASNGSVEYVAKISGLKKTSSSLSFTYTSDEQTQISFDWACYNYASHQLRLYVDGVYQGMTRDSYYSTKHFYLEPGKHMVTLQDSVSTNTSYTQNWSKIKNVSVKTVKPLETAVLSENSEPLTFTNDAEWPWTVEDGYIQNSNYGTAYSASEFSTTFTIDKLSKFSFDQWVNRHDENTSYASDYHTLIMYINGDYYYGQYYTSGWQNRSVALEPGEYTIVIKDTIYNTTTHYYSRIKNLELSSDWIDVELATAGSLGVEVLYKVNILKDVEMLKVKGNLNSTDWTTIKNMDNLIALDLSEAKFDAVPDYAFDGLSQLSNVKLPNGMKTIGEYAFRGTRILNIDIPASVTSIGQYAFASTIVRTVNFTEDSQLKSIGYSAFSNCTRLKEFIMPNTVTALATYNGNAEYECNTFRECTDLKKIHFSNNLKTLGESVCYGCANLEEVVLPENLHTIKDYAFHRNGKLRHIDFPESLSAIEYEAFSFCGLDSVALPLRLSTLENLAFTQCHNLKYIELPSYIESYNENFSNCGAVEKVVCQSATPPSIAYDPFAHASAKSSITLVVPSFAVVNYKLDTYWYQFGSIVEGDDIDYWKITSALSLTNNRRMNGKPDIDLYYGGCFTVGGNAPMETGLFNLHVNESNPGRLLNDCASMTADSINTYYAVNKDKWYFFTPIHDVDLTKVSHSANASYVFRYYDAESRAVNGTGNSWRNVDTGKLLAGQGYIFHCNANGTLTMPADATAQGQMFNVGDVTRALNAYESTASANKNWNYVGNPYPAYFDIYYMDFTAPITVWTGSTYKAYSIADDNFVLRPMQSFFVQKPDEIDNIVFHKEGRQLSSAIERPSYARYHANEASASRLFFDLKIANEDEEIDETRIVINDDAGLEYEVKSDASKFMSMREDVPQIYTIDAKGNSYAINERPMSDGIVYLGYRVSVPGYYTISTTRTDAGIILYDNKTNKSVDLCSQDYYFYSEATEDTDNTRFILKLDADSNATNVGGLGEAGTIVHGGNGCIDITCGTSANISIYTADGRLVCNEVKAHGKTTINVPGGLYLVKVNDNAYKTVVF